MRRYTRPLAFAAGAALAVGAVSLATLPSQAQEVTLEKLQFDPGYVYLDTKNNVVTSTIPDTSSQSITVGCELPEVLNPANALLDINALGKNVTLGYGKNGIGVAGRQDKNGTRCADVDAEYRQALEVAAATGIGPFSAADLDIEFKGGSSLTWEAYLGPNLVGKSGDPTSKVAVSGLPGDTADNGPDSGDGDNYRVQFWSTSNEGLFDRLVLTPTGTGAFSLEGGGDGTDASPNYGTTASVFVVSDGDGLLLCDQDDTDGYTEEGVTVFLTDCESGSFVPFTLERFDNNEVLFGVPASADNAYRVEIQWDPVTASIDLGDVPQVRYFTNGNYVDLDLCDLDASANPVVPPIDNLPSGQGFCVTGRSMDIGPVDGQMVVTERLYGVGDPFFKAN